MVTQAWRSVVVSCWVVSKSGGGWWVVGAVSAFPHVEVLLLDVMPVQSMVRLGV
jgi:hypothetical protein